MTSNRTIEVYHLLGPSQQLLSRMWFINNKDFQEMAVRLTTAAPSNTSRRNRHEACQIRLIYSKTFETEYHTDGLPNKILNICTEYMILYGHALKLAQSRGWLRGRLFSSPAWQHWVILKHMRKATRSVK